MINIASETVLSFVEAAARLPKRRAGKRPHVATLYRWAQRGVRNVRLETIQIGGTSCTSLEALQRFFDRLAKANPDSIADGSPCQPGRGHKEAEKLCEEAGI